MAFLVKRNRFIEAVRLLVKPLTQAMHINSSPRLTPFGWVVVAAALFCTLAGFVGLTFFPGGVSAVVLATGFSAIILLVIDTLYLSHIYSVADNMDDANERIQKSEHAGTGDD